MQARYYDPVIGRFYSNDPVGFTGEVDTFNRYSYVANNPYKYTDPAGESKVYIWNKGPTATPGNDSSFGHVSIQTEGKNPKYISKFPTKQVPWKSEANFKTYEQDKEFYGRDADIVIDLDLPDENAADDFADTLLKDPEQTWDVTDNCADTVESVINAGGVNTPKDDPINTPQKLKDELID
ncbi:RHS repeat-associated core domain-containing protein [Alteromonas aestuariivivens]|uniref:RHS repeat-associated core domain-containing protein n=2 Tax=Alteromonas aestuariivivens TaxID=1938339 RepID=A0A3D8M5S0_9ALTE|nr:RHS repeat-associated core domain-containing protein [Alteromonas aestuariivivens]